jgi:hypothetical protein
MHLRLPSVPALSGPPASGSARVSSRPWYGTMRKLYTVSNSAVALNQVLSVKPAPTPTHHEVIIMGTPVLAFTAYGQNGLRWRCAGCTFVETSGHYNATPGLH